MRLIKERILAILKERALAIMVVLGIIVYTTLLLIIGYVWASNKYEDDIARLEIENKKKEYKIARLKKDSKEKDGSIEDLQAQVDGKKAVECDCGWFQDFYYDNVGVEWGVLE